MKNSITLLLLLVWSFIGFVPDAEGADYYWVGNTGNWTDLSHWASTSGGAGLAYTELPGADDNVIFNSLSFTAPGHKVTLPVSPISATCQDFTWTNISAANAPTLEFLVNSTLNVYGTLSLDADVIIDYESVENAFIVMRGTGINPAPGVFAAGLTLPNLEFNAVDGEWGITGTLNVEGTLKLTDGELGSGATNVRRTINVGTFSVNGADAIIDLSRMDITAGTQFIISNVSSIQSQNGGNLSSIITPLFQVSAAGAFDFGSLEITGTTGILNASGRNLTFIGDVELGATNTNTILGSHTFESDLILSGLGSVVFFEAGMTQTLESNSLIIADGTNCSNYITLRSTVAGSEATISKDPQNASDVITVEFVNIQDLHAVTTIAGTFVATNSQDLGNSTGWDITGGMGIPLYWIGGSGDWSDGNNWSATTGGVALGCIPTAADDVFFDNNSFTSTNEVVTVDLPAIYFNNMTWTAPESPTWDIPSADIYVGGSMILLTNMTVDITAKSSTTFHFTSGDPGNTISAGITSNTGHDLANVSFEGNGGWELDGFLFASESINFLDGTFSTGTDHNVESDIISTDGSSVVLNLNASEIFSITFEILSVGTLNPGGSNIYTESFLITPPDLVFNELILQGSNGLLSGTTLDFTDVNLNNTVQSTVLGSHEYFGLLQLGQPGMIVEFEAGSTQTMANLVSQGTDCGGGILLRTTESGTQVTFVAFGDMIAPITVANILLQDNMASAPMTFAATGSQDLGNNVNWDFSGGTATPRSFYWIGGTGNWNDGANWSDETGGLTINCIPTPSDDVFFDANSFDDLNQVVTLDGTEQYCRSMVWAADVMGEPTMSLPSGNSLKVYGSFSLLAGTDAMSLSFGDGDAATIEFRSISSGNIIRTTGHVIPNMLFEGPGGGWSFNSSITLSSELRLVNGALNTNGSQVSTPFLLVDGANAALSLSSSTLNTEIFQINSISSLNAGSSSLQTNVLTIIPGSLTFAEVQMVNIGDPEDSDSDTDTEISGDGLTFGSLILSGVNQNLIHGSHSYATLLQFDYNSSLGFLPLTEFIFDVGSVHTFSATSSIISNSDNSNFCNVSTTTSGQTATFFKNGDFVCLEFIRVFDIVADGNANLGYNSLNAFAPVLLGWIATIDCDLLPVECTDFSAAVQTDNSVDLIWTTAQEVNNSGFEVQRSTDGRRFEAIAWIEGKGTTSDAQRYSYTDRRTAGLSEAYYRLKQIDFDGTSAFACDIRAVNFRQTGAGPIQVFPNPALDQVQVRWFGRAEGMTLIRLFDEQGRLVIEREWNMLEGNNQRELPIGELPGGIYELQVVDSGGKHESIRVVKQ